MKKLTTLIFSLLCTIIPAQALVWEFLCGAVSGVSGVDIYVPLEILNRNSKTQTHKTIIDLNAADGFDKLITQLADGKTLKDFTFVYSYNTNQPCEIFSLECKKLALLRAATHDGKKSILRTLHEVKKQLADHVHELEETIAELQRDLVALVTQNPEETGKKNTQLSQQIDETIAQLTEAKKVQKYYLEMIQPFVEDNMQEIVATALAMVATSTVPVEVKKAFVERVIKAHHNNDAIQTMCNTYLAQLT